MHIDVAVADDLPEVAAIERLAFTDPWSLSAFAETLAREEVFFAVARRGAAKQVAGGGRAPVLGYVVAIFAGDEGEIANLAVVADDRRRGVGSGLLEAVLAEARQRGVEALYLEVRESNDIARRLYGSRGFEEIGRRRGYYRHPSEDALVLRRLMEPRLT